MPCVPRCHRRTSDGGGAVKKWLIVSAIGVAMILTGCGGPGDSSPEPTAADTGTAVAEPTTTSGGSLDCSILSKEDVATFAVWAQLFAQVRTPSAMQGMTALGYDPAKMEAYLDALDALKGTQGEVYGTPDEALVVFRSANDTYAAVIAKGDSATDADFASLNEVYPDVQSWIQGQASIFDALNQACPDLGS
jgi:hypothetical protein